MTQPRMRNAVRAVVMDSDDRIFLVRMELSHASFWCTPGGGIEAGETLHQALHRELHEEVGDITFDIGPQIWTSTRLWPPQHSRDHDGQTNAIFLVRVDSSDLGTSLLSEAELREESVVDRRWWTLQELEAASTEFAPLSLPRLVAELLESGPPLAPIDISVDQA